MQGENKEQPNSLEGLSFFFFFFLWLQCCKIFTASLAAFLVSVLAAAQPPAIPANENIFVAWER